MYFKSRLYVKLTFAKSRLYCFTVSTNSTKVTDESLSVAGTTAASTIMITNTTGTNSTSIMATTSTPPPLNLTVGPASSMTTFNPAIDEEVKDLIAKVKKTLEEFIVGQINSLETLNDERISSLEVEIKEMNESISDLEEDVEELEDDFDEMKDDVQDMD